MKTTCRMSAGHTILNAELHVECLQVTRFLTHDQSKKKRGKSNKLQQDSFI
jgi:hypothetical protein